MAAVENAWLVDWKVSSRSEQGRHGRRRWSLVLAPLLNWKSCDGCDREGDEGDENVDAHLVVKLCSETS